MKKCIVLFLLLGCIVLSACSADGGANAPLSCEPMEKSTAIDTAKNSSVSVLISVNPKIKLFLDAQGNVTVIQCLNDDAKALFDGAEFASTQEDYPTLLENILGKLYAAGYLTDGGQVNFEIYGPTEDSTMNCNITSRSVLEQFCTAKEITASASCSGGLSNHVSLDGIKEVPLDPDVLEVRKDENGNIVWALSQDASNGATNERFYAPDGTLLRAVTHHPQGFSTYLWFDENEEVTREYTAEPGTEVACDDNGVLLSAVYKDSAGNITGHADFDNGILVYEEKLHSDGQQVTSHYDTAGRLLREETTYPDGRHSEQTLTYYPNGNRKTQTDIDHTGLVTTWSFSEDGRTGTTTYANGTVVTEYYRADGSTEKEVRDSRNASPRDELYTEITYDTNRTPLTRYTLETDGREVHTTFHGSWDRMTTVFRYPNGGGHTEYWIGNTMIGGIDSDGNVWGDTFSTYSGPVSGGTTGKG